MNPFIKNLFFIFYFFYLTSYSQPAFQWAKQFGGVAISTSGIGTGTSVAIDGSGNVYTTGYFEGTADFDPGVGTYNLTAFGGYGYDVFVSKIDASGNFVWAVQMGAPSAGTNYDYGFGIAVDGAGNVYTTGQFAGTADFDPGTGTYNLTSAGGLDIFVSKLNSSGAFVWAKSMGGQAADGASSIAVDLNGNVYTTGSFNETVDFDPGSGVYNLINPTMWGSPDIFVSKLDASGNFVWAERFGGTSNTPDYGFSIAVDGSGNVYTTGSFGDTCDFDPGTGIYNLNSAGGTEMFVSKLDASGNFVWADQIGVTGTCIGASLALDGNGNNIYTTGQFSGTVDFDPGLGIFNMISGGLYGAFVQKIDASGNFILAKQLDGTGIDWEKGNSIKVDVAGNIYTTGYFWGTTDFDPGTGTYNLTSAGYGDIFISQLDSLGNFVCAGQMGGTDPDVGNSIALDGSGNIYTTGTFSSGFSSSNVQSDFDPGVGIFNMTPTTSGGGMFDIFVSKLSTCGFPFIANFTLSEDTLCAGSCINFTDLSANNPTSWNWSFTGGSPVSSNSQNPSTICYNNAGTYAVMLIADNANGTDTATWVITVNPPPTVDAGINVTITQGSNTILTATGGGTYSWAPSTGLSDTAILNPVANPDSTTTYYVTVTDANGCTNIDSVTVFVTKKVEEIKCGELFLPTAFSPNGDGQNDVFYVRGNCIKEITFSIYDRWGENVFETTDIAKGWDGKYKSQDLNTAVFMYYLNATLSNDELVTQKGNISLIK